MVVIKSNQTALEIVLYNPHNYVVGQEDKWLMRNNKSDIPSSSNSSKENQEQKVSDSSFSLEILLPIIGCVGIGIGIGMVCLFNKQYCEKQFNIAKEFFKKTFVFFKVPEVSAYGYGKNQRVYIDNENDDEDFYCINSIDINGDSSFIDANIS